MSGRILGCTAVEYHADPCPTPSLSSSIAHKLINQSPLHAWHAHPKLGGRPPLPTREMDTGQLVHALLLGATAPKGSHVVSVIDAKDWRKKATQAARDDARGKGQVPVLARQYERAVEVTKIIEAKMAAHGLPLDGKSELVLSWEEESMLLEGPVACRAMLDHFRLKQRQIIDLKTCDSAHPKACIAHAINYGYLIQHAAYASAVGQVFPEIAGRLDFVFVFAEVEPPYCVTPVRLDGSLRQIGEMNWNRAVEVWGQCLSARRWPEYAEEIITLEAPPWLLARELGEVA